MPYAVLLALVVALFDLIPLVGSTIAGVIVSLVALTKGVPVAVATVGFYVVYRYLEDYLLNPRVMKHTVKVTPGLTIIATLIGGTLLGLIGALIAYRWRRRSTSCSKRSPSPAEPALTPPGRLDAYHRGCVPALVTIVQCRRRATARRRTRTQGRPITLCRGSSAGAPGPGVIAADSSVPCVCSDWPALRVRS